MNFTGKTAVVTGGSRGLGRAVCLELAAGGANVVLCYAGNENAANETVAACEVLGARAVAVRCNVADSGEVKALMDAAVQTFGRIDILVNNAGITRRHRPEVFPREDWDAVISVNLNAVWFLSQLAGQVMLEQHYGKIINIASMSSYFGGTTVPPYTAAKHGVAGLTKALSNDWAGQGICVNAIAPGYIATALNTALIGNPDREPKIMARIPAGRWGVADDVKGAAVFLAAPASDYVSGIILPVDGGYLGA